MRGKMLKMLDTCISPSDKSVDVVVVSFAGSSGGFGIGVVWQIS